MSNISQAEADASVPDWYAFTDEGWLELRASFNQVSQVQALLGEAYVEPDYLKAVKASLVKWAEEGLGEIKAKYE